MKRLFSVLSLLSCFLLVSCSGLFENKIIEGASIKVLLPEVDGGGARAAEEAFPDNHYGLSLYKGETVVKELQAAAGNVIEFDELEAGTYNIVGFAKVNGLDYYGTAENIEVKLGEEKEVSLTLKILDYCNPKVVDLVYESNKPEFNRYLGEIKSSLFNSAFKEKSIVKISFSGVPTEDLNGELNYYYGEIGANNVDWTVLASQNPATVTANRKKDERFTDTFIFHVTGAPKENGRIYFGVWYSAKTVDKPMQIRDVELKYEYIDSDLPENVSVKSVAKGLEITVKKPADVEDWNSLQIEGSNQEIILGAGNYLKDTMTFIWPFVKKGEVFTFNVSGNFNNEWRMIPCAAVYTGEDTGKEMNDSLLKKIASSTAEIGEDYQLHFNTELTISDFNSITNIPNLEYNVISGMYAGEMWEKWVDEFDLHGINEINDLINSRLNMTEIRYLISSNIKELIERFEGREYYAVDIRIRFEAKDYPNQYFMFKNIQAEHCPVIVPPAEKVVTLESGSYIISEPISEAVEAGDYVLVKFSGDFCYEGDSEFETEIRGILYNDDTDICTMDDVRIEETITQNKTVNFSYGFYVRGAFPGDARIEIVVSRTGGDIPPDYITIKNHQCEIEVQKEVDGKVTLVMPGATAEIPLLLDFISTMELDEPGAASSYVVTISGNADSNIAGNLTCAMVVGVPRTGGAVNQKVVILSPNAIDLSPGDITRELFFDFTNMDDGIAGPCDSYLTLTFDLDAAKSGGKISDFSITITKQ